MWGEQHPCRLLRIDVVCYNAEGAHTRIRRACSRSATSKRAGKLGQRVRDDTGLVLSSEAIES